MQEGNIDLLTELPAAPASFHPTPKAAWRLRIRLSARLRRLWLLIPLQSTWREFHDQLTHDQAFADAISRRLDIAAAGFLFFSYTLTVILIFAINGSIYGKS